MKAINLYNEIISWTKFYTRNKSPSVETREKVTNIVVTQLNTNIGQVCFYVLNSSFKKELDEWVKGKRFNMCIKGAKYDGILSWAQQIESLTKIIIRAGYIAYMSAKNEAKNLFKCVPDVMPWVISKNINKFISLGKNFSYDKDRVNLKLRESKIDHPATFTGPARIVYNLHVAKMGGNKAKVTMRFRHHSDSNSLVITERLHRHIFATLMHMPHVSDTRVDILSLPMSSPISKSPKEYVCVEFIIDGSKEFIISSPKELLENKEKEKQSPDFVEISPSPDITDEQIKVWAENKLSFISDEIGVLIQERDSITEQIQEQTNRLEKIRKIIEVL